MRNLSPLVALIVFALASTASAEEAAPAAETTAPAAGDEAAAPAPAPAPVETTSAPAAGDVVATPAATPPTTAKKKLEVGLAFLPMGMGRYTSSLDTLRKVTTDASFAYGVGLSVGYEVLPHLVVGLAPQVIFNVEEKVPAVFVEGVSAARQYDLMGRVAGVLSPAEGMTVYAEVLPGYSIITSDATPKGFVVAFGLGVAMDLTDRFFINVGGGYQIGFQKWAEGANTYTTSTRFVRVALGGGVRL